MSLTIIATIVSILNGGVTFIKSIFGKSSAAPSPEAEVTQAVQTLNKTAAVEADAARQAQQSIDAGDQHAQDVADSRHEQLAAAAGLRARAAVLEASRDDSAAGGADTGTRTHG
jgi:hypothetical protein